MPKQKGVLLTMWMFLLVFTPLARAHDQKFTGVKIQSNQARTLVSVVAHGHNFRKADPASDIPRRLRLRINGEPFVGVKAQLMRDKANGIVMWQAQQPRKGALSPTSPPRVSMEAPLFPELGDSTVVTVFNERQVLAEAVVNARHPSAVLDPSAVQGEARTTNGAPTSIVARGFVREGITHIFSGIDHVLFLLSLLLLGGNLRQILKIVTAFTLAHSITLSLAATSTLTLPPRLVEPVIALSIVVVALSNIYRPHPEAGDKRLDLRPLMAFGFGLVHGFGFAGALSETQFPRESLGWVLLCFNAGIEIGQVALVLLFAPTLALIARKWPPVRRPLVSGGSAAVAVVGAFWFVQRVWTS